MNHPRWVFASALGNWVLAWSPQGVCLLRPAGEASPEAPERVPFWVIQAVTDLRAHFSGRAQDLTSIPVLVLVPCHWVVSAAGPGGWSAFGSPDIKERLLALEKPNNGIDVAPLS